MRDWPQGRAEAVWSEAGKKKEAVGGGDLSTGERSGPPRNLGGEKRRRGERDWTGGGGEFATAPIGGGGVVNRSRRPSFQEKWAGAGRRKEAD